MSQQETPIAIAGLGSEQQPMVNVTSVEPATPTAIMPMGIIAKEATVEARSGVPSQPSQASPDSQQLAVGQGADLPIESIAPDPLQPRQFAESFGDLTSLAASIKKIGVIQSILVRCVDTPMPDNAADVRPYRIVAGERRWRAARIAGLSVVPVICRPNQNEEAVSAALAENLHRKGLSPLEVARQIERMQIEFGYTQTELRAATGLDQSRISRYLALLELPDAIQLALRSGRLTQAHAESLVTLPPLIANLVAVETLQREWTTRQTRCCATNLSKMGELAQAAVPTHLLFRLSEAVLPPDAIARLNRLATNRVAFAKSITAAIEDAQTVAQGGMHAVVAPVATTTGRIGKTAVADPNLVSVEKRLGTLLGSVVTVQPSTQSKGQRKPRIPGRLIVQFFDNEELDGILARIRGWAEDDI